MEIVIRLDCLGDGKKKFWTFSVLTQIFPNMLLCVSWVHKYGTSIGGGPTLYVTNVYPQANSAASWDSGETVILGSKEASEHVIGIVRPLRRGCQQIRQ